MDTYLVMLIGTTQGVVIDGGRSGTAAEPDGDETVIADNIHLSRRKRPHYTMSIQCQNSRIEDVKHS